MISGDLSKPPPSASRPPHRAIVSIRAVSTCGSCKLFLRRRTVGDNGFKKTVAFPLSLESTASSGTQGRLIAAHEWHSFGHSRCRAHENGRHSAARYLPGARGRVGPCPDLCPVATRQHETRGLGPRPVDADARRRARQVSGANPRLANACAGSSLNAERREYRCRSSDTHWESPASGPFGATARHDATRRAAWP